ncbi:hypothetical protein DEG02_013515 [Xanthomonas vasicola]|uniref:hypothetical protein n=1 Tax=Xanthomonas vasicola TaxID=56459 RepID=UPI0009EBFBC3|nr:hypothetical protein [Xanthomonas vasicola]AZR29673.1 hypothetical protein KWO_003010 [Xanthomonas vasicola pv. musacearum NCPPB 4379]RRJ35834.1 hypothetical protein EIM46_20995 [Xanthomonas vasicola pv. musacearum]MDO6951929.1 hypothetical protein [Xanthomonas vasicola]RJL81875.1 hypothetical protein DEG03_015645 [Xanthomonas vasicola]RJL84256.1 hypothetical protein DEF98_015320 [Xanthomonas vasicola]
MEESFLPAAEQMNPRLVQFLPRGAWPTHAAIILAGVAGSVLAPIRILDGLRARKRVGQDQNLRQFVPKGI